MRPGIPNFDRQKHHSRDNIRSRGRGGHRRSFRRFSGSFDNNDPGGEGDDDEDEAPVNDKYPYHPLIHPRLLDVALKDHINPVPSGQTVVNSALVEYIDKLRSVARPDPAYNEPVLKPVAAGFDSAVPIADSEGYMNPFLTYGDTVALSRCHPLFSGTLATVFSQLIQYCDQGIRGFAPSKNGLKMDLQSYQYSGSRNPEDWHEFITLLTTYVYVLS
jgi:hypothetical protein